MRCHFFVSLNASCDNKALCKNYLMKALWACALRPLYESPLGLSGPLRGSLGLSAASCGSLGLSGRSLEAFWKVSGVFWQLSGALWGSLRSLGLSGALWCSLELSGALWVSLGLSGLSGALCGSPGALWGSLGLSGVLWGSLGLSEALRSLPAATTLPVATTRRKHNWPADKARIYKATGRHLIVLYILLIALNTQISRNFIGSRLVTAEVVWATLR